MVECGGCVNIPHNTSATYDTTASLQHSHHSPTYMNHLTMNSSMMDPPLSTGNTSTTVFLYLPLSTDAPDLLGFASVNGFYGPGSWAAFFLAICASWISLIFQSTSGVVSLCAYLLALNAVAVDHLRHLHALTRLKN